LVGCNNADDDVPPADETPMEDVRDEGEEMENDLEDAGDELLPDEDTTTENGTNGTYDNGTNGNNGNGTNGNNGTGNVNEEEEILEDDMDMNDTDEKDE
jgi:hypothetical protein